MFFHHKTISLKEIYKVSKPLPEQSKITLTQIVKEEFEKRGLKIGLLEEVFEDFGWFSSFYVPDNLGFIDTKSKKIVLNSAFTNYLINQIKLSTAIDPAILFAVYYLKVIRTSEDERVSRFCDYLLGQFSQQELDAFTRYEEEFSFQNDPEFTEEPREVFVGQVRGFNYEDSKYRVDPRLYPPIEMIPSALIKELKIVLPDETKQLVDGIRWKTFRARMAEQLNVLDHGLIRPNTNEVFLPEDFLQYLQSVEPTLYHRYILRALTYYPDNHIRDAADRLYKQKQKESPVDLEVHIKKFKEAEYYYRENQKDLNVLGATFNVKTGELRENMQKIMEAITKAEKQKAHLLVLPELITTAYQLEDKGASPDFQEKHTEHIRTMNRYTRFLFMKRLVQSLSKKLSSELTEEQKKLFLNEIIKNIFLFDQTYIFSKKLFEKGHTDSYFNWVKKQLGPDFDFNKENYEDTLKHFKADQNIPYVDKKDFILKVTQETLKTLKVEKSVSEKITRDLDYQYDDWGVGVVLPAIIKGSKEKPYNGFYVWSHDGSSFSDGKKHMADDQGTYFMELHYYYEYDQNVKTVYRVRGRNIGINVCEDGWREPKIHSFRQMVHPTAGILTDPRLKKLHEEGIILNLGAEFAINVSASPERHPEEIVHRLDRIDWENMDPHFMVTEKIHGITWKNDRNETRVSLLSQVAQKVGLPILYINSFGGYDKIFMGGCRILVNAKGQRMVNLLDNQQGDIQLTLKGHAKILVPDAYSGNQVIEPLEEFSQAIVNVIRDYAVKNDKISILFNYDNSDFAQKFMISLIPDIRERNNQILEKKVTAQLNYTLFAEKNLSPEQKKRAILREMRKNQIEHTLTYYGGLSIKKILFEPFQYVYDSLRYKTNLYANLNLLPVGLIIAVFPELQKYAGMNWALLTSWLWLVPLEFLFRMFFSLKSYQYLNRGLKGFGFANKLSKLPSEQVSTTAIPLGKNNREPVDPDFLPEILPDIKSYHTSGKKNKNTRIIDRLVLSYERLQGLYYNNISILKGFYDFNIKQSLNALEKPGISFGYMTRNTKLKGFYPKGGQELGDFNVTHTISDYTIRSMYVLQLKKILANSTRLSSFKWHLQKFRLNSALKDISSYVETRSALTNIFYRWINPWGINKTARFYYKRRVWRDIQDLNKKVIERQSKRLEDLRKDPKANGNVLVLQKQLSALQKRAQLIQGIIGGFEDKIEIALKNGKLPGLKKRALKSHKSIHLPGLFSQKEWIYRDTRHNRNMGNLLQTGMLAPYFPRREFKRISLMKDLVDPYHLMSDENYAALVARLHVRDMRLHKNQSVHGVFFEINSRGSFVEPISSSANELHYVEKRVKTYLTEYQKVLRTDLTSVGKKLANQPVLFLPESRGSFADRDWETHVIKRELDQLIDDLTKSKYSKKAYIVIKDLIEETDVLMFKAVQEYLKKNKNPLQIEIMVLTTRQSLSKIHMPESIADLQNLLVFSNELEQNFFITSFDRKSNWKKVRF